jgi:hypothetical protein
MIRDDPARLAMWNAKQEDLRDRYRRFAVTGCGRTETYTCEPGLRSADVRCHAGAWP